MVNQNALRIPGSTGGSIVRYEEAKRIAYAQQYRVRSFLFQVFHSQI